MAQSSWPFENIDTDETQFSQWARHIGEGVATGIDGELEVTADSSGMNVKVERGEALVRGHYYKSTAVETLVIPLADLTNPRIDLVVLELDPVENEIVLKVLAGTPDPSPVAPTPTQSVGGIYQLPLASVDVSAAVALIAPSDVTDSRVFIGALDIGISDVDGLQAALDAKQATITGAATTITTSNLTINRAVTSDSSGKVAVSAVTSTELGHVAGVTSAIQTQLNGKSPLAGSTSITTVGTVTTVTSPTAAGSAGLRKTTISTADPTGGADGDVWLKYA
jgi:hypothetical protein